ncbi:hypothetical protein [Dokdonia pacifica]|uniref:Uncharacterized protein n=2 Tax=Dokdonia pacifica TaxID=1627892 RepID=A0A239BMK4_9FLAO|nr:hypothetical protein [Dokdonia pacifica]SNS08852.1 hypothetical protein SAMN06265376_106283 [Dokdonia pacifica]
MGQRLYMITIDTKKIQENLAPFIDKKIESHLKRFLKEYWYKVSKEVLLDKVIDNPNAFTILEVECLYFWLDDLHDTLYRSYQNRIRKIRKTGSIRADVLKMNKLKFLKHYGVNLFFEIPSKTPVRAFLEIFYYYFWNYEKKISFFEDIDDLNKMEICLIKDLHHFSNYFLVYCGQIVIHFGDDEDDKKEAKNILEDIKLIDLYTYKLAVEDTSHLMNTTGEGFKYSLIQLFYYAQGFEKEIVNLPINTRVWNFHT